MRRIGQDGGRSSNNDAAGQVFTIVSGLQAVVLAFVLVTLLDAVTGAGEGAHQEAQDLVAVSWAVESLPSPTAAEVRSNSAWPTSTASSASSGRRCSPARRSVDLAGGGWCRCSKSAARMSELLCTPGW